MTALVLYLKFNVLLAAAWLLWWLTREGVRVMAMPLRHGTQLRVARGLFLSLLCVPVVILVLNTLFPGALNTNAAWQVGLAEVTAGLETQLSQPMTAPGIPLLPGQLLWGGIALVLMFALCRLGSQWWSLRTLLRRASLWKSLSGLRILFSEECHTPFSTCATGRPCIVLPTSLLGNEEHWRIALRHELQHVRNGDLPWLMLLEAIRSLCSWNPAAWLWQYEFDALQEYACDEALLQHQTLQVPQYGRCLLAVASHSPAKRLVASSNMIPALTPFGSGASQLRKRIQRMNTLRRKDRGWQLVMMSGLLTAMVIAINLALFPPQGVAQEAERGEYLPRTTIPPSYPRKALELQLEGYVKTSFSVDRDGRVYNAAVVNSCASTVREECMSMERKSDKNVLNINEEYQGNPEYNAVFHASALAAVTQFTFEPRTENGEAVETADVHYVFSYRLAQGE